MEKLPLSLLPGLLVNVEVKDDVACGRFRFSSGLIMLWLVEMKSIVYAVDTSVVGSLSSRVTVL